MEITQKISPMIWFDDQARTAAETYVDIFPRSRILTTTHYSEAGREFHGQEPGTDMTVTFELAGCLFTALNGGPMVTFNEAVSLQVYCDDQEEVDYYWERLGDGGDPQAQRCGWLKDRFGLSWQVVPVALIELLQDSDGERAGRVMQAVMTMTRIDIAALRAARDGGA